MHPLIVEYGSTEYEEMLSLRTRVLREPLGLSFSENDLEKDKDDILLGLLLPEGQKVAACCILTPINSLSVKLRQMAVDNDLQQSGLGTAMLSFAEYVSSREGFQQIILNARKTAIGFYEKYGYQIIGEEFTEVGIPHYKMKKEIIK